MERVPEALIRLELFEAFVITTDEYEQLTREVLAHAIADPDSLMAQICARFVDNMSYRYNEAKLINAQRVAASERGTRTP